MSELNKAIAELLGMTLEIGAKWNNPFLSEWWVMKNGEQYLRACSWSPSTNANQAQAAVKEWCGEDDRKRQGLFVEHLVAITSLSGDGLLTEFYSAITATPEELCQALIAAAKESQ